ncbi:hypothetical protein IWQ56_007298, partial [Coemansia nantahalensis]
DSGGDGILPSSSASVENGADSAHAQAMLGLDFADLSPAPQLRALADIRRMQDRLEVVMAALRASQQYWLGVDYYVLCARKLRNMMDYGPWRAEDPVSSDNHRMSVVEATSAAAPSRCESPLLPMGQHQTDPDRLQQQAGRASHRQSQQSVLLRKTYAIPDDRDAEPPAVAAAAATVDGRRTRARHYILRPHRLPRPAVHRLALPARDLSSRL